MRRRTECPWRVCTAAAGEHLDDALAHILLMLSPVTSKVRCDGEQPACGLCTRLGRPCNYNRVSEAENLLLRARKRALKVKRAGEKKAAASGAQDMADDADETMTDAPGGSQDAAQQPSSARRRSRVSTAGPHSSSATDTLSGSRSRSTSVSESISPAMTSVDNFAAGVMMPWQSSSMQLTSAPGSPTAMDMSMPALPTWLSKPAFGDVAPHGTVAPHATMSAQNANTTAWAGQQQQQMQQYSYGTQGAFGGGGTASRPPPVPYAVGGSSLNAARGSADMMTGSWRSAGSWGSCPYGSSDGSDSAPSSLVQRRAATRAAGGQSAGQEVQLHMSSQPHAQPSNLASTSHGLGLGDASMQYTQGGSASTGSNTSAERHNPYDLRLPAAVVQNAAEQWRQSMGYPKTENPASSDVAAGPHGDSNAEHNLSNEALRSQRFGNFTLQQPANMQPQTSQQDQGAGDHVLDMPKLTHQGAGGWAAALASTGNSSLLADPLAAARAATAGSIQWTPDESGPQGFPRHLFDQHSQGQ
jgi:hypothetical protein